MTSKQEGPPFAPPDPSTPGPSTPQAFSEAVDAASILQFATEQHRKHQKSIKKNFDTIFSQMTQMTDMFCGYNEKRNRDFRKLQEKTETLERQITASDEALRVVISEVDAKLKRIENGPVAEKVESLGEQALKNWGLYGKTRQDLLAVQKDLKENKESQTGRLIKLEELCLSLGSQLEASLDRIRSLETKLESQSSSVVEEERIRSCLGRRPGLVQRIVLSALQQAFVPMAGRAPTYASSSSPPNPDMARISTSLNLGNDRVSDSSKSPMTVDSHTGRCAAEIRSREYKSISNGSAGPLPNFSREPSPTTSSVLSSAPVSRAASVEVDPRLTPPTDISTSTISLIGSPQVPSASNDNVQQSNAEAPAVNKKVACVSPGAITRSKAQSMNAAKQRDPTSTASTEPPPRLPPLPLLQPQKETQAAFEQMCRENASVAVPSQPNSLKPVMLSEPTLVTLPSTAEHVAQGLTEETRTPVDASGKDAIAAQLPQTSPAQRKEIPVIDPTTHVAKEKQTLERLALVRGKTNAVACDHSNSYSTTVILPTLPLQAPSQSLAQKPEQINSGSVKSITEKPPGEAVVTQSLECKRCSVSLPPMPLQRSCLSQNTTESPVRNAVSLPRDMSSGSNEALVTSRDMEEARSELSVDSDVPLISRYDATTDDRQRDRTRERLGDTRLTDFFVSEFSIRSCHGDRKWIRKNYIFISEDPRHKDSLICRDHAVALIQQTEFARIVDSGRGPSFELSLFLAETFTVSEGDWIRCFPSLPSVLLKGFRFKIVEKIECGIHMLLGYDMIGKGSEWRIRTMGKELGLVNENRPDEGGRIWRLKRGEDAREFLPKGWCSQSVKGSTPPATAAKRKHNECRNDAGAQSQEGKAQYDGESSVQSGHPEPLHKRIHSEADERRQQHDPRRRIDSYRPAELRIRGAASRN